MHRRTKNQTKSSRKRKSRIHKNKLKRSKSTHRNSRTRSVKRGGATLDVSQSKKRTAARDLLQRWLRNYEDDDRSSLLREDQRTILKQRPLTAQSKYRHRLPQEDVQQINRERIARHYDQMRDIIDKKKRGVNLTLVEQSMLRKDNELGNYIPSFSSIEELRSNSRMDRRHAYLHPSVTVERRNAWSEM